MYTKFFLRGRVRLAELVVKSVLFKIAIQKSLLRDERGIRERRSSSFVLRIAHLTCDESHPPWLCHGFGVLVGNRCRTDGGASTDESLNHLIM